MLGTRKPQQQAQDRFPTFRIWGRLLWKEWREDWPILAIGIVLPLLTLPLSNREGWTAFDYSALGLVGILLVLWAADRARRIGMDRGQVRQALPIATPTRWIFTHLAPLPVPVLAGISVGIMMHAWHAERVALSPAIIAGVLYLVSAFFLATILTPAFSPIAAIITGVVWLFLGLDAEQPDNITPLFLKIAVASLVVSVLWEVFALKGRYWAGRVVMIVVLLAFLVNPMALPQLFTHQYMSSTESPYTHSIQMYDHTIYLRPSRTKANSRKNMTASQIDLQYVDRRRDFRLVRAFQQTVQPLDFITEDQALLGEQLPGQPEIRLLIWDVRRNLVREMGHFTAVKDLLSSSYHAFLSPDGRYLALFVQGRSDKWHVKEFISDIWVVDLARGHAVPVLVNVFQDYWDDQYSVSWTPERLYFSGRGIEVDLRTMRGRYLTPADFRRKP